MADERLVDAPSPPAAVADPLEALGDARFITVTTFRRSGEGVATPVEFVARDGAIYVRTLADLGKVKRIRNNHRVRVAACSIPGTDCRARIARASGGRNAASMSQATSYAIL